MLKLISGATQGISVKNNFREKMSFKRYLKNSKSDFFICQENYIKKYYI